MPESPSPLRWSAYEHEHIERGSDWYWALGIIAVSAAITSILFGNVLFAILIAVASGTIGLLAARPPELHEFEISQSGIRTGHVLHDYESIIAFWIDEESGPEPLLLVDTTKMMAPNLVIPLADIDPETVRDILIEHVDEIPMKEPLAHKILEYFGF